MIGKERLKARAEDPPLRDHPRELDYCDVHSLFN
jgi:hypothetical protein